MVLLFTGAPPEVLDAGKTLVEFIEAVKKEYDVRSYSAHVALSFKGRRITHPSV